MIKNYFFTLLAIVFCISSNAYGQNVALDFDGIDDFVQTNYSGISGNGARTIEAWIKTTKNSLPAGSGGAGQSVIADWGTFVTGGRFTFNILWSNAIRLEVGGNGLSGNIPVNDGNWHHVAVTYDPTSNPTINLYVDGIRDVAGNVTIPVNTGNLNNMRLGNRVDGVNFFEGGMDEVRVYNYEKDSISIYNDMGKVLCGTYPSGLVSYFKLDEGVPNGANLTNGLATDYVPNNTNALIGFALNGSSSNWTTGPTLTGGNTAGSLSDAACASYTSPSGNHVWNTTGIYTDTLLASNGCDSILTVDLTILQSYDTISVSNCGPYVAPSGQTYTTSGNYQDTLTNANAFGCDSIIFINLLVGSNVITIIDTTVCDEITINGVLYSSSTSFMDTVVTTAGCDSLITYDITIYNSITTTETITACDSAEYNGVWYFSSQQFMDVGSTNSIPACDSIHVIDVIVNQASSSSFDTIVACDSIFIEGTWYTEASNIEILYSNAEGCDSTHFIDLSIESFDFDNVAFYNWEIRLLDTIEAVYDWYDCSDSSFIEQNTTGILYNTTFPQYYVVVTTSNCMFSSPCYPWQPESIQDLFNTNFTLSPNPNSGSFQIDLGMENKASSYRILDLTGKEVERNNVKLSTTFNIKTSLSSGMYVIIIETNNGPFANKFLVK